MRIAGLPKFRKLYRIVNEDLNGNYTVDITNNYMVSSFSGSKSVVVSQTNFLGGKNPFLGIAYMVVGSLCLAFGLGFLIGHFACGRKQGDESYLQV